MVEGKETKRIGCTFLRRKEKKNPVRRNLKMIKQGGRKRIGGEGQQWQMCVFWSVTNVPLKN